MDSEELSKVLEEARQSSDPEIVATANYFTDKCREYFLVEQALKKMRKQDFKDQLYQLSIQYIIEGQDESLSSLQIFLHFLYLGFFISEIALGKMDDNLRNIAISIAPAVAHILYSLVLEYGEKFTADELADLLKSVNSQAGEDFFSKLNKFNSAQLTELACDIKQEMFEKAKVSLDLLLESMELNYFSANLAAFVNKVGRLSWEERENYRLEVEEASAKEQAKLTVQQEARNKHRRKQKVKREIADYQNRRD